MGVVMTLRGRISQHSRSAVGRCLLAGLVFTLPGCRLKKPPDTAAIKEQALPTVQLPAQWTAAGAAGTVADNWLATFADEQLTAAVAEAIAHNVDLRVAATRVEQAMLYAKLAGAKLWPSADVLARGGGKMSGDNSGLQGATLSVSWELDLWGRVRYGRGTDCPQTDRARGGSGGEADLQATFDAVVATTTVHGSIPSAGRGRRFDGVGRRTATAGGDAPRR